MLRALGHDDIQVFHLNEGHSALLALALLKERLNRSNLSDARDEDIDSIRRMCVFTTHTPIPAGHDKFPLDLVEKILGKESAEFLATTQAGQGGYFKYDLTRLDVLLVCERRFPSA